MNEMISIINDTLDDELLENYIRSNRNLKQVATKRVKKTKNGFELTKTDKGIILITSDKAELAYQYAIMNESMLIGESTPMFKVQLPVHQTDFNKSHVPFQLEDKEPI